MDEIKIWNRDKGMLESELVYGAGPMRFLYQNSLGRILAGLLFSQKFVSFFYGLSQSSRLSSLKVKPFIKKFKINMDEYAGENFKSFNDFFIRRFRAGKRVFPSKDYDMGAFAEGRYYAFESLNANQDIPVKGFDLSITQLLNRQNWIKKFDGGPCFIARLCPTDYHRFHYPDTGMLVENYTESGKLHSVNPLALEQKRNILFTNEREISILDTKNFGQLAYIEVGAMCVGKIVQSKPDPSTFKRGEEKGYFLFGGSTVILLGQKGAWRPSTDLIAQTIDQRESLVQLGETIAKSP